MTDPIIEKIQKLFNLARNSGATEAEAAQALTLAHRLMTKHGLDQTHVEVKPEVDKDYIKQTVQRWHQVIIMSVGEMFGTTPIFNRDGDGFNVVGRTVQRGATITTYVFIIDQIEAYYKLGLPKGLSKGQRAKWRKEFKLAASIKVSRRIDQIIEDMVKDDESAIAAVGCTALVVMSHRAQLESEVDDFINANVEGLKTREMVTRVKPTLASALGRAAGEKVRINQELEKADDDQ